MLFFVKMKTRKLFQFQFNVTNSIEVMKAETNCSCSYFCWGVYFGGAVYKNLIKRIRLIYKQNLIGLRINTVKLSYRVAMASTEKLITNFDEFFL